MVNTQNVAANEISTYANPNTVTTKTFVYALSFGTAGSKGGLTLDLNMKLTTDSIGTTMTYSSYDYLTAHGTTSASIYAVDVHDSLNYTSNFDNHYMYIDFYIKTVINSKTYYTVYRFIFYRNNISSHYILESPSTTKHPVQNR